jgi:general stress protein 26
MGFTLNEYSEKAILLTGDTKEHREELKAMYGKWMPKKEGWVFSKKRRAQVEEWIEDNTVCVYINYSCSDCESTKRFEIDGEVVCWECWTDQRSEDPRYIAICKMYGRAQFSQGTFQYFADTPGASSLREQSLRAIDVMMDEIKEGYDDDGVVLVDFRDLSSRKFRTYKDAEFAAK